MLENYYILAWDGLALEKKKMVRVRCGKWRNLLNEWMPKWFMSVISTERRIIIRIYKCGA